MEFKTLLFAILVRSTLSRKIMRTLVVVVKRDSVSFTVVKFSQKLDRRLLRYDYSFFIFCLADDGFLGLKGMIF